MRRIAAAVLLAAMAIFNVSASADSLVIRVAVTITADAELQSSASSYLLRELRELPNVVIVERNADLHIHIVGLQNTLVSGRQTGYTLAIALTRPEDLELLRLAIGAALLKTKSDKLLSDDEWNRMSYLFQNKEEHLDLSVRSFAMESLRDACATIVADLDTRFFEQRRKSHQILQDASGANTRSKSQYE